MNVAIIDKPLRLQLYGLSGISLDMDHKGMALRLSDELWRVIRTNNIKNKGLNTWVYEPANKVFVGIEPETVPEMETGLEQKTIILTKYAYYKHIGPYQLIREAGMQMQQELASKGFTTSLPYIEIYGHWTGNEDTTETELLMTLE